MIRNIVFDMGQVLVRFDRDLFIRRLGVEGEDARVLLREVFLSLEWAQMDWGSITDSQAAQAVSARVPARLRDAAAALVTQWDRPILPVPGMEQLIGRLKQAGYGIYLLSNASFRQHEYWPRVPGQQFFDGTLISCDVGCVKPERAIYEAFLTKFGLQASACFFVDDLPVNVEGARRCGMDGAVFHGDAEELRIALRRAGVAV